MIFPILITALSIVACAVAAYIISLLFYWFWCRRIHDYAGLSHAEVVMRSLSIEDENRKIAKKLEFKDRLLVRRGFQLAKEFHRENLITILEYRMLMVHIGIFIAKGEGSVGGFDDERMPWKSSVLLKRASEGLRKKSSEFRADLREHRRFQKIFRTFFWFESPELGTARLLRRWKKTEPKKSGC